MDFIEEIKQRAKKDKKTIVLPEASDIRTLEAARTVLKEDYANIILLGNEKNILNMAKDNGLDLSKAKIIDPKKSEKTEEKTVGTATESVHEE